MPEGFAGLLVAYLAVLAVPLGWELAVALLRRFG